MPPAKVYGGSEGIVVEETELDQAIEGIIGMSEAAEEEHAHKAAAKRTSKKEKMTVEDVRKRSMEWLAETQKRPKSEIEVKKKGQMEKP